MHLNTLTHPRGFTLVELMIVISMIIILMGITLFPYNYYMDRSRIEKDGDLIAQEWILAHNDVKNGLLYSPDAHAHLYLTFQTGASSILLSVSTGGTSPDRPYKIIPLESKVVIQGFSSSIGSPGTLIYHISPPLGKGMFSTGGGEFAHTGIILRYGYPGASLESGRSREILLRPYY